MLKYLIIGAALLAGWLYFTQSGNKFYSDFMEKSGAVFGKEQEPEFIPDQREVRRLGSLIAEKSAKLAALNRELDAELKFRAANKNKTGFRTDPIFLESSIKRLEVEKDALEADLRKVNHPPAGSNAR